MAGTFPFELVSPERVLFSGDVGSVVVPAAEGDLTVLPAHAPFMAALRSGIVTVDIGTAHAKRLYVGSGFCDVSEGGLTLLALKAIAVDDINVEALATDIKNAQDDLRDAKSDDARAKAQAGLDELKTMMAAIRN